MEHKLDELQQQGSRLGPSNLSKHDQATELEHEVLQLTAENEVSHTVILQAIRISCACRHAHAAGVHFGKLMLPEQIVCCGKSAETVYPIQTCCLRLNCKCLMHKFLLSGLLNPKPAVQMLQSLANWQGRSKKPLVGVLIFL